MPNTYTVTPTDLREQGLAFGNDAENKERAKQTPPLAARSLAEYIAARVDQMADSFTVQAVSADKASLDAREAKADAAKQAQYRAGVKTLADQILGAEVKSIAAEGVADNTFRVSALDATAPPEAPSEAPVGIWARSKTWLGL